MRHLLPIGFLLATASCTFGPVEKDTSLTHLIRLGDSYRAVAVLQHSVYQEATGLNAFPNGGTRRYLERRASQFLLDAESGRATRLATQEAPDSLWESFGAYVHGVESDSSVYIRLIGCPRGGECHPALQKRAFFRLTASGRRNDVERVPEGVVLPGFMGSRRPGEQHYVRFSTSGDTISARLEEGGPFRPLFVIHSDGMVMRIRP